MHIPDLILILTAVADKAVQQQCRGHEATRPLCQDSQGRREQNKRKSLAREGSVSAARVVVSAVLHASFSCDDPRGHDPETSDAQKLWTGSQEGGEISKRWGD